MAEEDNEEKEMRSVALQNAQSIFLARQRAERELQEAKEALERKTSELAEQREWFRVTLSSIGDAVITTDIDAKVTFLNPVAEALTGWKSAEAEGQPLENVFHIINEDTRLPVENPIGKVLREGIVVALANHTALIAKDGRETAIEDSAAPIRDAGANTVGAVMVFHDVTERRRTERALRQSEARLSLAMEAAQMGPWEWSIASGKVTWSPTLEAIHGLAPGAFRGTFEEFQTSIHPEDRDQVLEKMWESVRQREDYRVEYRVKRPDGGLRWIEGRGRVFTDDIGNPDRIAGICTDVTERKRVVESLQKSEIFNRTIIESSGDCTKTLSLDGILLWMSDAAQRILCVDDVREYIGKSWLDFWKGADREAAVAAVAGAAGGGVGNFVGWHSVLGQPKCWDVVVTPILDRIGKPERLLVVSRDVTERRKLEEVHSRLAAVVEFSDDAIVSKTLNGIITTWNKGAERTFGYTAAEVIGKPVTILIPADRADEELRILASLKRGEVITPYETIRMRKDGTLLNVSLTVSPIKDGSGTIIGASKIARDITPRKKAEAENARLYQELRHANAAKDHFIAVLSHELRTPLNPVLMTVADLERDETVPPAIREQLTVVRRNVELEARLIDDLLDSTRIASGKLQLHRAIVDANELVRRAVAIVESDARSKGVRLEVTTCAQPCPVDADPARLQQVIWNVVKNAVKFAPEHGWVRLTCEIEPPGRVRLKVEDNGIGIAPEHLDKIFNAFEQGDARTGHRFGGLGLGLAISKALVTLHGGSLVAHSEGRGRGATFVIELPLAVQPPVKAASGPAPSAARRALRLLLVEDHEATSHVMVRLLTKRGYSVFAASNIEEALAVLKQTPVDVLISDVGLPDGSGRDLMEKVRQIHNLPGIALSGYGTEADLAQSSEVGFSVHLTKPVDIDHLDREIQSLANGAKP
jgi:PAS domain S-box-containing protein